MSRPADRPLLERVLQLITTSGTFTLSELANRLDVSDVLLDAMLSDLVRMGYLRIVHTGCADCAACPDSQGCSIRTSNRAWVLTEAGRRLTR